MDVLASFGVQVINGLASASALYLVAVGLALIFGVTRIVNFAHGAFFMVGLYIAIHLNQALLQHVLPSDSTTGLLAVAYWASVLVSAVCVAIIAAVLERLVLSRIYTQPELFQLLATFAWVLIAQDAVLYIWGAEEVLGPRAPGLTGVVDWGGRAVPSYDILLLCLAPMLGYALHLLLTHTTLGLRIRAISEDREMAQALGIQQQFLLCATFALGCGLAGLGGALQMPREPASSALALSIVGDAFVVIVIGGMGSLSGAYIAAVAIGVIKAACIWLGTVELWGVSWAFPKLTQVIEFILMTGVLLWRPQGLMGRKETLNLSSQKQEYQPLPRLSMPLWWTYVVLVCLAFGTVLYVPNSSYAYTLLLDVCIAILFAQSLHVLLSPAGIPSFGHAALFGVGAYAFAIVLPLAGFGVGMLAAAIAGIGFGLVTALLTAHMSGVYRAMLTLAIAQLLWSTSYQWDSFTGGSNGLTGLWPPAPFDQNKALFLLCLGLCVLVCVGAVLALRSRWGLQIRALRDSPQRAISLGLYPTRLRSISFMISGAVAAIAGALYVCAKGTVAPDVLSVHQSVNGLVMVLLGGINTLTGAITGALTWTLLNDALLRNAPYWRAALGGIILIIIVLLPRGISAWFERPNQSSRYV